METILRVMTNYRLEVLESSSFKGIASPARIYPIQ
jgi:hypothetical protein